MQTEETGRRNTVAILSSPQEQSYAYFRDHHLVKNEPCIFTPSLVASWPAATWTLDTLQELFGHHELSLSFCLDGQTTTSTVSELVEQFKQGGAQDLYARDWHLPLNVLREGGIEAIERLVYTVPEVCKDDWMNAYWAEGGQDDFRFIVSPF
jgi:hypothetical protein